MIGSGGDVEDAGKGKGEGQLGLTTGVLAAPRGFPTIGAGGDHAHAADSREDPYELEEPGQT